MAQKEHYQNIKGASREECKFSVDKPTGAELSGGHVAMSVATQAATDVLS